MDFKGYSSAYERGLIGDKSFDSFKLFAYIYGPCTTASACFTFLLFFPLEKLPSNVLH